MYSIGLDFGTNSVRCVLLDLDSGSEAAWAACDYPSGDKGILSVEGNPHLARQNPADYHLAMEAVIRETLEKARACPGFRPELVIGIGVDTTGSTPLPVDARLGPLSFRPEFAGNLNAMAWLWKDHTASAEAREITDLARRKRPGWLAVTGGVYSSEWYFAKLLRLARTDPAVYRETAAFIELCDYIPALLAGIADPRAAARSICAAGHKAMYGEEWGGLPDQEFLDELGGGRWLERSALYEKARPAGESAGRLCAGWAARTGLPEGIPVSVGAFDAHLGAVGVGVRPGVLVKVVGTSGCDMTVAPAGGVPEPIPGICGIVPHSILPGLAGIEAGQAAVGDIFNWFVKKFPPPTPGDPHEVYSAAAARLAPGASGLLALDWHNGNRNILVDEELSGLVAGLTLGTGPAEIYRALLEATGFGARVIIERLEQYGVEIKEIVATGGIPGKNPLLMQIYADITGRGLRVAASAQACAVGAAVFGAVAAGPSAGGFREAGEAREKVCRFSEKEYRPVPSNRETYDRLYRLYRDLHDHFGTTGKAGGLFHVMKELLAIRKESSGG